MYDFQKHFEPDFSSILIKSYFIFPIALFLFTYGFTELDRDALIILAIIFILCTLVSLYRTQYITFKNDHIVIENGFRKLFNKSLKIYFDKIYSLNYLNSFMTHIGSMSHLELTFYKSGKNQSLFSINLQFIKDWPKLVTQINELCDCKKTINSKKVKRLVAFPERHKDIYI